MSYFTQEQKTQWKDNGFVHLKGFLNEALAQDIKDWTQELYEWEEAPGKWMKYFETSSDTGERLLCRVENFIDYHKGIKGFLCGEMIYGMVSELMGEQAVLFKEKINFKYPGGAGFAYHQDAPAFTSFGQKYHITMMVSVDASNEENGCLRMAHGFSEEKTLEQEPDGTVCKKLAAKLDWRPLETGPGDLVLFNSYVPHYSEANTSDRSRRAMFITYNRLSEGEKRLDYFKDKREKFPPEAERIEGKDYSSAESLYNLGNPIK
uniref:2-aminoethylphosphonate dioxygenase n=1 Tax=Uncultured bacterium HF130_AEPn_1 TaxID=663362 RepID=PHNY_UNCHF|nr:RecName: Full=2-aminoethylphosphonate dioxygenase; AltName: Full=2-oxoglutarate dioxygensase; AltName: Full=Alpha-ketoglutarate/Fe(II)-dependent dioxygenase PhnY [uncultured bacterium HF130_AEPn_1]ACU83549.1 2-oxoglutarate dependent dioxygenase PhnY [uncultured bacterium HF130_AEPn_1]